MDKGLGLESFAFMLASFDFVSFPLREHLLTPRVAPNYILRNMVQVHLLIIYHVLILDFDG